MTPGDYLFQSIDPATPVDDASSGPTAPVGEPVDSRPRPTPHQSKLMELQSNTKVPPIDHLAITAAIQRYNRWIADMRRLDVRGEAKVRKLVQLLNDYKRYIEVDLIWNSEADFMFRQRGQLKIDNSILEEFLPWLVDVEIIPELAQVNCFAGSASSFAAVYFSSTLASSAPSSIGLKVRTKDQDFTLSRPAYVRASFSEALSAGVSEQQSFWLTYLAAECKTNLDKTMFQEAAATSHDLKIAVPAARYYLICEYLDMAPISSAGTDIDEVLILRGKRLASNIRSRYSTSTSRIRLREEYVDYLDRNPIREDMILRFVEHMRSLLTRRDPLENDVLERGYF